MSECLLPSRDASPTGSPSRFRGPWASTRRFAIPRLGRSSGCVDTRCSSDGSSRFGMRSVHRTLSFSISGARVVRYGAPCDCIGVKATIRSSLRMWTPKRWRQSRRTNGYASTPKGHFPWATRASTSSCPRMCSNTFRKGGVRIGRLSSTALHGSARHIRSQLTAGTDAGHRPRLIVPSTHGFARRSAGLSGGPRNTWPRPNRSSRRWSPCSPGQALSGSATWRSGARCFGISSPQPPRRAVLHSRFSTSLAVEPPTIGLRGKGLCSRFGRGQGVECSLSVPRTSRTSGGSPRHRRST